MRLSLGSAPTGTRWQESLAASVRHHLSKVLGRGEQTEAIVAECVAIAAAAAAPPTATFGIAAEFGSHGSTLVLLFFAAVAVVYVLLNPSKNAADGNDEDDGENHEAELLALFSNPALPKEAARFGLRPLAFGQDLKLLLHALPTGEIDVEPAATLLSAQQALVRSSPRFLLFSGHTILEALAFESEDGRLDLHADPSFFVTLLETLNNEHETAARAERAEVGVDSPPAIRAAKPPPPLAEEPPPLERAAPAAAADGGPRAKPPVMRGSSASRSMAVPLDTRQQTLFAHLDKIQLEAAEKIQRYARGQIVRAQSRELYDEVLSTRRASTGRARRASTAREVSALVERFRERLGVEPPTRPRAHALARLKCVVLNGCQTDEIGRHLVRALPKIAVVCWSSVAEDSAARAFAVGFYAAIAERLHARARFRRRMRRTWPLLVSLLLPRRVALSVLGEDPDAAEAADEAAGKTHERAKRAFEAGCYAFTSAGFRFGDPADWLHPPGHAHSFRPDLTGACHGCTPPVHGSILMLTVDPKSGEIIERRGDAADDDAHGTGSSFSRLLAWRRRSRIRALQANEAVPTRSPAWQVAGAVTAAMRTPKPSARSDRLSRWTLPEKEAERASMRQTLADSYRDEGDE